MAKKRQTKVLFHKRDLGRVQRLENEILYIHEKIKIEEEKVFKKLHAYFELLRKKRFSGDDDPGSSDSGDWDPEDYRELEEEEERVEEIINSCFFRNSLFHQPPESMLKYLIEADKIKKNNFRKKLKNIKKNEGEIERVDSLAEKNLDVDKKYEPIEGKKTLKLKKHIPKKQARFEDTKEWELLRDEILEKALYKTMHAVELDRDEHNKHLKPKDVKSKVKNVKEATERESCKVQGRYRNRIKYSDRVKKDKRGISKYR